MAKKKHRRKKNSRRRLLGRLYGVFLLIAGIVISFGYNYYIEYNADSEKIATKEENKIDLDEVKDNYHDFVSLRDGASLWLKNEQDYQEISVVHGEIEVTLDSAYEVIDEYFKLLNSEYYVKYNEVSGIEELTPKSGEYKYYQNYIVYNESVVLRAGAKLYVDDSNYYEVDGGSYPIIVKDTERYGFEYNNGLVYVNSEDVESVIENVNTDKGYTDAIAVLNYHYTVSATNENGELYECKGGLCLKDTAFDSQIKYLKDNGYYAVSMRDLELFIDGKIQLPEKSVSITIDDGWYVARSIIVLERYQMLGTLFLIGNLASPDAYRSNYLEVHSHTWDMHGLLTGDDCPSSGFRGGITCFDSEKILEDLKKSRESLNNTTYFCYPFYDYNTRAIELLKQAGFTMAFAGTLGDGMVHVGTNKYLVPRYVIMNYTTMDQFISYVS